jgi:hypothetical protein
MLEAGYEPVWDNRINMGFRCGARPPHPSWPVVSRLPGPPPASFWRPQEPEPSEEDEGTPLQILREIGPADDMDIMAEAERRGWSVRRITAELDQLKESGQVVWSDEGGGYIKVPDKPGGSS